MNTQLKAEMEGLREANAKLEQRVKQMLVTVQVAWDQRETDWKAHIERYKSSWEEGAAEWMELAQAKVAELKLGADVLAKATALKS